MWLRATQWLGTAIVCLLTPSLFAQTTSDDVAVATEHPRLLLPQKRLRLLKRERERQSVRWQQLELLVRGNVTFPEPGLALALAYAVSGDAATAQHAIEWALGSTRDLRQVALVFDWCQPALKESQKQAIIAKLRQSLPAARSDASIAGLRSRAFAAIALADHAEEVSQAELRTVLGDWRQKIVPALPRTALAADDLLALYELLHVIRDNLNVDLREGLNDRFVSLPSYLVLMHYPAPFPAGDGVYRIPFYDANGDPDLNGAARSRAAGFSMVAFDNNATESQFLQGWLLHDEFILKSAYGAPYEFLWANPYQPGLSYYKLPLAYHDAGAGILLMRSSWDDDAAWFGDMQGKLRAFSKGRRMTVSAKSLAQPMNFGETAIVAGGAKTRLALAEQWTQLALVGLKPGAAYQIEIDDEELSEAAADAGGALLLDVPGRGNVIVKERGASGDSSPVQPK